LDENGLTVPGAKLLESLLVELGAGAYSELRTIDMIAALMLGLSVSHRSTISRVSGLNSVLGRVSLLVFSGRNEAVSEGIWSLRFPDVLACAGAEFAQIGGGWLSAG
jgi:hypothetical protein